jgi:hypothetical protein
MFPARNLLSSWPAYFLVIFVMAIQCRNAQSQSALDEGLKVVRQQVALDDALPSKSNPAGLKIHFSRISESFVPPSHRIRYRFNVPSAIESEKYSLAIMMIGSGIQVVRDEVYVNARGLVMEQKPRPDQEDKDSLDEEDEVEVEIQAARGEPVRFILISADHKLVIPGTVVPYPIESKNVTCRLEARLGLRDAEGVLVYAEGLPPNTEVPFLSVSEGESHPGKFAVQSDGRARTIQLPYVAGKTSGILKVSVDTKECSASVEIPWGKGSYHPL